MSAPLKQLGHYRPSVLLAETLRASVWRAYDNETNQHAVLRVPKKPGGTRARSALDHQGLMRVLSSESTFQVIDGFEGETLDSVLARKAEPDVVFASGVLHQLAGALDYLHGQGLAHGWLNESTVLVGTDGRTRILDAGEEFPPVDQLPAELLARAVPYASPEALLGEPFDGRADQFSLAVLGCRLLTGQFPFGGDSPLEIILRTGFEEPDQRCLQQLPEGAQSAIVRSLKKSPEDRFVSCMALVSAIDLGLGIRAGTGFAAAAAAVVGRPDSVRIQPPADEEAAAKTRLAPQPTRLAPAVPPVPSPAMRTPEPAVAEKRSRAPLAVAAVVVLLAMSAAAGWFFQSGPATIPETKEIAQPAATAVPASGPPAHTPSQRDKKVATAKPRAAAPKAQPAREQEPPAPVVQLKMVEPKLKQN